MSSKKGGNPDFRSKAKKPCKHSGIFVSSCITTRVLTRGIRWCARTEKKTINLSDSVDPQTFDFTRFHYFSEHTSALKIIP